MSTVPTDVDQREQRLNAALAACLEAEESGQVSDRQELIARYPEFTVELTDFFVGREQLDRWASPLRVIVSDPSTPRIALDRTGTEAIDSSSAPPVQSFGDYEILEEIGRGGMGVVYKARQKSLNRLVALKMIRSSRLASKADVQRFKNEAEAIASLDHPNIVPVNEVGELEGQLYFSMKLIEGGNLVERIGDFRISDFGFRMSKLVATIAHAVHHAHQRGILHRDLKPSNILLDGDGRPYITDFGLAKRLASDSHLTLSGEHVGTPAYMAPEQIFSYRRPRPGEASRNAGEAGQNPERRSVTTAADVYGLGAILYFLLTGRPPFRSDTPLETLDQVRTQEPISPCSVNPAIDRDLETVCLTCLEKEPENRYHSAEALAEDLERWLEGKPIEARPVGWVERFWRWCRRNPRVAGLVTAVTLGSFLAAIALGTTTVLFFREKTRAEQKEAETQNALEQVAAQKQVVEEELRKSRERAYVADMALAYDAWQLGNVEKTRKLLAAQIPTADLPDVRGFEWYYLSQLVKGHPRLLHTLTEHKGEVYCVAYSPVGHLLASAGQDAKIRIWNPETGTLIRELVGHESEVNSIAFSEDGNLLASASDDKTGKVWEIRSGQVRATLRGHRGPVVCVAFCPHRLLLLTGGADKCIKQWDALTGRELRSLDGLEGRVGHLSMSADEPPVIMLSCGTGRRIRCSNVDKFAEPVQDARFSKKTWIANFSRGAGPGPDTVAAGDTDGEIHLLWESRSGEQRIFSYRGHREAIYELAFSADDSVLASASEDATARLWQVPMGTVLGVLKGHASRVWCVAFSPNDRQLATASRDGTVKVWDFPMRFRGTCQFRYGGATHVAFAGSTFQHATKRTNATIWYEAGHWDSDLKWQPWGGPISRSKSEWPARFTPNGMRLATLDDAGKIGFWKLNPAARRWDFAGSQPGGAVVSTGSKPRLDSTQISPDFSIAACILENGRVFVRGLSAARPDLVLPDLAAKVGAIAMSPDGSLLALGMANGSLGLWSFEEHQYVWQQPNAHPASIGVIAFSPSGAFLASAAEDGTMSVWDATTGHQRSTLIGNRYQPISLALLPDGKTLAADATENRLRFWHVATGLPLFDLPTTGEVRSLTFSEDGEKLVGWMKDTDERSFINYWLAPRAKTEGE
jgi:eukaryotic-like serine/threonine-protein kinase